MGLESGVRAEQASRMSPLWPLPDRQRPNAAERVASPWRIPKAPTPYNIAGAPRQRTMAQMKQQGKTPEKELSDKEIANLSDAEFKTLAIRMLTELIELGRKRKEQMKATQSEIKQNSQGTNSDRKETGIQIDYLEQRKK